MVARAQYSGGALQIALTVCDDGINRWHWHMVRIGRKSGQKKNYKNVLLALGKSRSFKQFKLKLYTLYQVVQ